MHGNAKIINILLRKAVWVFKDTYAAFALYLILLAHLTSKRTSRVDSQWFDDGNTNFEE